MEIIYDIETLPQEITEDDLQTAAETVIRSEGLADEDLEFEISLSFVELDEIHSINKEFRDKDAPTDVLSFPQYDCKEDLPGSGYVLLGDVVICPERAREQAAEYGHSVKRELTYLFVHSLLHLLGYDHMEEADKKIMRAKEETIMEIIGVTR